MDPFSILKFPAEIFSSAKFPSDIAILFELTLWAALLLAITLLFKYMRYLTRRPYIIIVLFPIFLIISFWIGYINQNYMATTQRSAGCNHENGYVFMIPFNIPVEKLRYIQYGEDHIITSCDTAIRLLNHEERARTIFSYIVYMMSLFFACLIFYFLVFYIFAYLIRKYYIKKSQQV